MLPLNMLDSLSVTAGIFDKTRLDQRWIPLAIEWRLNIESCYVGIAKGGKTGNDWTCKWRGTCAADTIDVLYL